jgi:hypothetical protein
MNGFEESATLSRIDQPSSNALRVPSRSNDTRSVKLADTLFAKPPFAVRVPTQGVPGAVVQTLLQTVVADGLPDMKMTGAAKVSADQQSLFLESFDRAQRVASGRAEAGDIAWLSKGFSAFLAAGGALSLERCLGLPRNTAAVRRAHRDYWLRQAWQSFGKELSPWRRSERLATAVRDFQSRRWIRWRTLRVVPALATELEAALFEAFRSTETVPHTAMQLHNIAKHRRHS